VEQLPANRAQQLGQKMHSIQEAIVRKLFAEETSTRKMISGTAWCLV
jgi:hypothetical protein